MGKKSETSSKRPKPHSVAWSYQQRLKPCVVAVGQHHSRGAGGCSQPCVTGKGAPLAQEAPLTTSKRYCCCSYCLKAVVPATHQHCYCSWQVGLQGLGRVRLTLQAPQQHKKAKRGILSGWCPNQTQRKALKRFNSCTCRCSCCKLHAVETYQADARPGLTMIAAAPATDPPPGKLGFAGCAICDITSPAT
jgi:hypothetical protein